MCRAVPRRVLEVDGARLLVDYDGRPTWVNALSLDGGAVAGEYVVVYAGEALEKMHTDEAEEFLAFQVELERMLEEGTP